MNDSQVIRTSFGPRAARIHVGGGRTGFFTGVGPVGFCTSLGRGRRSRSGGARTTSAASYQRQLAAQQRARRCRRSGRRRPCPVVPGIAAVRVAVLRNEGPDAYGRPRVSCLLAATFDRSALHGVRWQAADAAAIVHGTSRELLLKPRPRTGELLPLDLAAEPALAQLVAAVDLAELTGTQ